MKGLVVSAIVALSLASTAGAVRQMEFLDRGLVGVKVNGGVF